MKLTLLVDLDNTLLTNEMEKFVPAYLGALSAYFPQWPAGEFQRKLLFATQAMINKNDPTFTLEKTFDQVFYSSLGVEKEQIITKITDFYRDEFPKLKQICGSRPEAVDLLEKAFAEGLQVVIATNPIFPRIAIEHRLDWAGFSSNKYPFSLVSSFETFHFAKPNIAFFAEILTQLGYPDCPTLMVGDSLEEDMLPCASLGIPGFLVTNRPIDIPDEYTHLIQQGTLNQVWPWIQSMQDFPPISSGTQSPEGNLAILKATPAGLETSCMTLSQDEWYFRPASDEWSLTEILCHLRDADQEVNFPRIKMVITETEPFLPGVNTDLWAQERDYQSQSGQEAIREFIDVRAEITNLLNQLPPSGWNRKARHAIFGPINISELVKFMSTHDIMHIRQSKQVLNAAK